MLSNNKIGILGAGAWGVSLAIHLSKLGYDIYLWCYEEEICKEMATSRSSGPFLVGFKLPENIFVTTDIKTVFENTKIIFEFIPILYLREMMVLSKPYFNKNFHQIISTSRGIETSTNMLSTEIIKDVLQKEMEVPFFCGIGRAVNFAMHEFSAAVIAVECQTTGDALKKMLDSTSLFVEISEDINGVQVASSLQYLFLIIPQIMVELGFSENSKSLFLSGCLKEVVSVVEELKGSIETIFGPCGGLRFLMNEKFAKSALMIRDEVSILSDNSKELPVQLTETNNAFISIINVGTSLKLDLEICNFTKNYVLNGSEIKNSAESKELFKSFQQEN